MRERDRYLLEVLETTLKTVERVTRRMDKEAAEDRETLGFLLHELREIEHDLHPPTPPPSPSRITYFVSNVFSGDSQMADNVLVLNVGQTSIDTLTPRLADGITPSGGVVSNVSVAFSDPSATAVLQPDNTILFTGVAASTGPISGSNTFTITDTDGAVSQWTVGFTVQVGGGTPPPPDQLTQSVANVFSTPV
jgi:hypothetical protein